MGLRHEDEDAEGQEVLSSAPRLSWHPSFLRKVRGQRVTERANTAAKTHLD